MYLAFDAGLGATLGSLLHSLSPVLTALLAGIFLGERLTLPQVLGFVVGVVGVLLVLGPDVDEAGGAAGIGFAVASVLGLSLGTLGQRWIGHAPDPLWSATIQFGVSAPPVFVLALLVEGTDVVRHPVPAAISIGYLAVVNSIIGLLLLGTLVRAGGAGAASSVFFLMPPVTAVLAWLAFGRHPVGPRDRRSGDRGGRGRGGHPLRDRADSPFGAHHPLAPPRRPVRSCAPTRAFLRADPVLVPAETARAGQGAVRRRRPALARPLPRRAAGWWGRSAPGCPRDRRAARSRCTRRSRPRAVVDQAADHAAVLLARLVTDHAEAQLVVDDPVHDRLVLLRRHHTSSPALRSRSA